MIAFCDNGNSVSIQCVFKIITINNIIICIKIFKYSFTYSNIQIYIQIIKSTIKHPPSLNMLNDTEAMRPNSSAIENCMASSLESCLD